VSAKVCPHRSALEIIASKEPHLAAGVLYREIDSSERKALAQAYAQMEAARHKAEAEMEIARQKTEAIISRADRCGQITTGRNSCL